MPDRDYMRRDTGSTFWTTWPVTKLLLIAILGGHLTFLLVRASSLPAALALRDHLWLWPQGVLREFQVWQLLTCALFHDPDSLWHVAVNALTLFWFGRLVEEMLPPKRMGLFCLGATVAASLAYLLESVLFGNWAPMIGASGLVFGVLVLAACWFPRKQVLFFMILPMPLWVMAALLAFMNLAFLLQMQGGIAHSAHLGGALYGLVYFRYGHRFDRIFEGIDRMAAKRKAAKQKKRAEKDADLRREVDRILDKVNREGMPALTEEERSFLKRASGRMRK